MDTPNIKPHDNASKPSSIDQSVERAVKSVQENYVVVGATHIRTWQGVLILGVAAGVAAGILLVANLTN